MYKLSEILLHRSLSLLIYLISHLYCYGLINIYLTSFEKLWLTFTKFFSSEKLTGHPHVYSDKRSKYLASPLCYNMC